MLLDVAFASLIDFPALCRTRLGPIRDGYHNFFVRFKDGLIDKENSDLWLTGLDQFAEQFHREGFRTAGAAEFYRVRERSIPDRAKYIVRDRIGRSLFAAWKNGKQSIREVERIIEELKVDAKEKIEQCDKLADAARDQKKKAEQERRREADKYNSISKINPILLFRGRKDRFNAYTEVLADVYAAETTQIASAFAKRLLNAVLTDLEELRSTVDVIAGRFEDALKSAQKGMRDNVRPKGEEKAAASLTTKLYDADHVRSLLKRIQQDQEQQEATTSVLRSHLVKQVGAQGDFNTMKEKLSAGRIVALSEEAAQKQAEEILAEQESQRDQILETSVIQKLYEEYDGRENELKRFIGEEVKAAHSYAPHDTNQMLGEAGQLIDRVKVAFVPAKADVPEELRNFYDKLTDIIKDSAPGERVSIVETSGTNQEIVFLSLVSQFALRHLKSLPYLKKQYENLIYEPGSTKERSDAARKRLELHLEGDGLNLPSLYPVTREEVRKSLIGHFELADACELLLIQQNSRTGDDQVRMIVTDDKGAKDSILLGEKVTDGLEQTEVAAALKLKAAVESHVQQIEHRGTFEEIESKLIERQNECLEEHGFDREHPTVFKKLAAIDGARSVLEQNFRKAR